MGRLSLLVACACTLALLPLCAAGEDRKAQTVDELARMYDVSSCKSCHEKIYEEWEKSLHARSILGTPRTADAFGRMVKAYLLGGQWKYAGVTKIEDLKTEHVIQCLECHLPQIKDATDAVARELAQAAMDGDTKTLEKVNINCIVCHNKKAIVHQWVDGPPEKRVMYGNSKGEHENAEFDTLKKSPVMKETIFCGQCHGLGPGFHHPNPIHCATLYGATCTDTCLPAVPRRARSAIWTRDISCPHTGIRTGRRMQFEWKSRLSAITSIPKYSIGCPPRSLV